MRALAIMAKMPSPGSVKTRLTPPLTPEEASGLYTGFLLDTVERAQQVPAVDRFIAYTPANAAPYFASLIPDEFGLIPQCTGDLGERLLHTAGILFDRGYFRVALIDSDSPTLPPSYIESGFAELAHADVVIGPCDDGGYYLIGLGRSIEDIFLDIPWSSDGVARLTLAKAVAVGATVSVLPPWYDVDTLDDLVRLRQEFKAPEARSAAPHTCRAFVKLGLMPGGSCMTLEPEEL
jgi:uncharacterized protein